jgi:hypothetical protein
MLKVEGNGYNLKLNDYWLHLKSKSKWGGIFLRNLRINVNTQKKYYDREDSNLNLSGLVNTSMYRKYYSTRAESTITATVCALSLYSVVRKNIALHHYKSIRLLHIM